MEGAINKKVGPLRIEVDSLTQRMLSLEGRVAALSRYAGHEWQRRPKGRYILRGGGMSDRLTLANTIVDAGIERTKAERVASVIIASWKPRRRTV